MNSRKALLLLCTLCLAACSTTQVHIFRKDMDSGEISKVQRALETKGYEITLNSLPVPEEVRGPTLLYSPEHRNLEAVERLGNQLVAMGYDIILEPVSRGNHFYTAGNVGLYLRPYQPDADKENTLVGREFNGDCADLDAYLQFGQRRFKVEFIGWDEAKQEEVTRTEEGTWRRQENIVTLIVGLERVDLELIPLKMTTQYGSVEGVKLLNRSEKLEGCDFVYREVGSLSAN